MDRQKIKERFKEYVSNYDVSNPKIYLKIVHTYKVAEIAERIALSLNLSKDDVDIAWILGMLHDIGRFEQCRIFDTFIDGESLDHARFGCHLLFGDDITLSFAEGIRGVETAEYSLTRIEEYDSDESNYKLIHDAIYYHNVYRLPENMDDRTRLFSDILRDADKIDILRVNVETPLEEVYNVTTNDLKTNKASKDVMEAFFNNSAIDRRLKRTCIDHIVGHISLVFELVYDESYKIVAEQGFLTKIMDFKSECEETNEQFEKIRRYMSDYIKLKQN